MKALARLDLTDAATFPSRRVEEWKYSDLKRFLREAPEPSGTAVVGFRGRSMIWAATPSSSPTAARSG